MVIEAGTGLIEKPLAAIPLDQILYANLSNSDESRKQRSGHLDVFKLHSFPSDLGLWQPEENIMRFLSMFTAALLSSFAIASPVSNTEKESLESRSCTFFRTF